MYSPRYLLVFSLLLLSKMSFIQECRRKMKNIFAFVNMCKNCPLISSCLEISSAASFKSKEIEETYVTSVRLSPAAQEQTSRV